MNLSDFIQSKTIRPIVYRKIILSSETVTLPAGAYDIMVIGTGGTGGSTGQNHSADRATGGGGPGFCRKFGRSTVAHNVVVTIGSRAESQAPSNAPLNGITGGTTTVTGTGINLTVTGGQGGLASVGAGVTTSLAGGAGGVATGGDINVNGSRGGSINSPNASRIATGGGAINLFALPQDSTRGGDIVNQPASSSRTSGGGGVGGRAGDLTAANAVGASAGGGAGGNAPDDATVGGVNITSDSTSAAPSQWRVIDILQSFYPFEPTGPGAVSSMVYPGGGTRDAIVAPIFGASGGYTTSSSVTGATVPFGGGSGAVVSLNYTAQASGAAGAAMVVITVYGEI